MIRSVFVDDEVGVLQAMRRIQGPSGVLSRFSKIRFMTFTRAT